MRVPGRLVLAALLLLGSRVDADAPAAGDGELQRLFAEWRAFQRPIFHEGVPDYTAAAMSAQRRALPQWQARLAAVERTASTTAQKVDVELLRAEMNGLDFDQRVLTPWSRDPGFYRVVFDAQSDTPAHEGPALAGAIELWQVATPVPAVDLAALRARFQAIPRLLQQARVNLTGNARDLWTLGVRTQREQSGALAAFAARIQGTSPELVPDVDKAREAVDAFRGWLELEAKKKTGRSGVGIENYDWFLRHVDLRPYTWAQERALMERELARATAHMKLEEQRNRLLPSREPAASPEAWQKSASDAVTNYLGFLRDHEILTMNDDMEPALRAQIAPWAAPADRQFFAEVDMREPLIMRCHQFHWFDLARVARRPHPDPVRRGPLLYNIWATRAEGFATAMEEMMSSAGLLDERPHGRELMYVMVAQRAARALASLRAHSNELTIDQAVAFASAQTPRNWMKADSGLVWGEQQLYLEQPGYGTSYVSGKAEVESLLAERARAQGDAFRLRDFLDAFQDAGLIPVSLIRWEMSGTRGERP